MKIGALQHRVSLANSPTSTPDSDGFYEALTPEWVWASIEPFAPGGDTHTTTHLVTIRYHPQVAFETRILFGTRSLLVKGIQNLAEDNVEMRLLCEEVR